MSGGVTIKGGKELQAALRALPKRMEKSIISGGLRAAARVVQLEARARVPKKTGQLARNIKLTGDVKNGVAIVRIVVRGKHSHLALFMEYGTAAHLILPRRSKGAAAETFKGKKALTIGDGRFAAVIHHPGFAPMPFLRPAADTKLEEATQALADYIRARFTDAGLDAPPIDIELDDE